MKIYSMGFELGIVYFHQLFIRFNADIVIMMAINLKSYDLITKYMGPYPGNHLPDDIDFVLEKWRCLVNYNSDFFDAYSIKVTANSLIYFRGYQLNCFEILSFCFLFIII